MKIITNNLAVINNHHSSFFIDWGFSWAEISWSFFHFKKPQVMNVLSPKKLTSFVIRFLLTCLHNMLDKQKVLSYLLSGSSQEYLNSQLDWNFLWCFFALNSELWCGKVYVQTTQFYIFEYEAEWEIGFYNRLGLSQSLTVSLISLPQTYPWYYKLFRFSYTKSRNN